MIRTKRVFEPPAPEDGMRVLVDRLWPRGVSKEDARIDWWARELAPSDKLRRWFGHAPPRYREFVDRLRLELDSGEALARLKALALQQTVTLVYAALDERHNNARALVEILKLG
ncbi:MAG: hypothetical protein A2Y78_05725 [Acidobacteria bacterium RBG_13_68_16]|jgi:uncharacterized protein YeaO (DUF488 family)|nr:MAG: hypothetical protein A2Y78_05725 [Acidobacteria bacterium RBG_13_68_16]